MMASASRRLNRRQTLTMLATATAVAGGAAAQVVTERSPRADSSAASGSRFVAATVHPIATAAARDAFERGGNAFDAAIAAALMLGVVDGHNSGLGGGCFVLGRTAAGQLFAIDGREIAPAAATEGMFLRDGQPDPQASQLGALASGVPGQVAALAQLSLTHGRGGWAAACQQAAEVARDGYRITASTVDAIRSQRDRLAMFPASAAMLLGADGAAPSVGSRLHQPDLANTLQNLATHGPDWFYRGPFARHCQQWMAAHGGLLTGNDFAGYQAKLRRPLETNYRQWKICGFPPPSSGGIHIAQMLMMLERIPLQSWYQRSPVTALHVITEVMKRAFADRAHWLGDADFADVPRGLIDPEYCRQLAMTIDLEQPNQWSPDQLLLEPAWPESVAEPLAAMGHELAPRGNVAVLQAIERTGDGQLRAASDPRVAGSAVVL